MIDCHRPPDRDFDLVSVDMDLKFNIPENEVFGTAVEKIFPMKNGNDTAHLAAAGMTVEKVVMNWKSLGYVYDGKSLAIGLGDRYSLNCTLTFAVVYSTIPTRGIYFVLPDLACPDMAPQLWSQSEHDDAHYWFTYHDYPDDFVPRPINVLLGLICRQKPIEKSVMADEAGGFGMGAAL
jgi:aminopeptidase N